MIQTSQPASPSQVLRMSWFEVQILRFPKRNEPR